MGKKVYVAMSGDIVHFGHMNIIRKASEYGDVIVGMHTDEVIASYWRMPVMTFEQRKSVIENIKGVSEVVVQDSLDQVPNLLRIKPDYVIHGDDWKEGPQKVLRDKVLDALKNWGGELIEIPYTEGVAIDKLDDLIRQMNTSTDGRRAALKRLIATKKGIRIMEAHNGLTGLIVEKSHLWKDGLLKEFDGMWLSSLCDSTSKGKPDIELVDVTSRLQTINEMLEVTTKPIIVDGDTGGKTEHFAYTVRSLERVGVSAIIVEDKVGLKKNSLFGTNAKQTQDSIEHFCNKIQAGKRAQVSSDFMIIARIESLILKAGMDDALKRARAYLDAGADGIMIHSIDKSGEEIFEFVKTLRKENKDVPIVVVPTAYAQVYEEELFEAGVNIIIYANHLLRSGYKAMAQTAQTILENGRAKECDDLCLSIKEILTLIDDEI